MISQVHNDDNSDVGDDNFEDYDDQDDNDNDYILFVQVEDPVQCDKYYVCETDGTLVPKLCEVWKKLIEIWNIACGWICVGAITPLLRMALCTTSLESLATTHKGLDSKPTFIALQIEVQIVSAWIGPIFIVVKFWHVMMSTNDQKATTDTVYSTAWWCRFCLTEPVGFVAEVKWK